MEKKYIKRNIVILITIIYFISTIAPIAIGNKGYKNIQNRGDTLYVGGSGPGNYTSIIAAINNASEGDTVFVYSGIYNEHIVIDVTITLIGEDKTATIIDGSLTGNCIHITADSVVVDGFTIRKGLIGVNVVQSSGQKVKNNIIRNNWGGINLYQVTDAEFSNNSITDSFFEGINPIQSSGNTFSGNEIFWNIYGILFTSSDNNSVFENNIKGNTRGIETSDESNNNYIYHNNFYSNQEDNAYDDFVNTWDDDYPSGGNYWDDYTGSDNDGDGIGDTPYAVPGDGNNEDRYPLMEPYIPQYPPNKPYDPDPYDGATGVSVNASLFWNCSDPEGDNLTFDVFFEADDPNPDELVSNNQTESFYDPPDQMQMGTVYYWQIIAWDYKGTSTPGPIWYFITESDGTPPSAPIITGPTNGKPNTEYEFTFVSTDPEGDAVMYNVDWGDGDTEWTEYGDSGVEVTLKHTWTSQGTFTIKAQAVDIYGTESDWAEFPITIPRNKEINKPILNLFKSFFQSHPYLFPLLQKLLQQFGIYNN